MGTARAKAISKAVRYLALAWTIFSTLLMGLLAMLFAFNFWVA